MLASATRRFASQRTQLQRTLLIKRDVLKSMTQMRSINTKEFLESERFAYTRELGRELTESVLAKYFALDESRPAAIAKNLSPHIIDTMIDEITRETGKIDFATANMLAEQAILSGADAMPQIEKILNFYLDHHKVIAAANVLCKCPPDSVHISQATCFRLLTQLVENCNWTHAFVTAVYMVCRDYALPHDAVFLTMGGLMKTSEGVVMALELIKVMTVKKRADLTSKLSFAKVSRFSSNMSGKHEKTKYRNAIPSALFEEVLSVTLAQLRQSGWFDFSQTKIVLALTLAANHDELAADFVRQAVQVCVERDQQAEKGVDVLSLLRSFSQGDGVAQRPGPEHTPYSSVTLALLELCWMQPFSSQVLRKGPMRCTDLFNTYWVLAHRARDVVVDRPECSKKIPLAVLDGVHADTQALYDQLRDFWSDDRLRHIDLTPALGYERRILRILCDAFGFKHRLVSTHTDNESSTTVRVYKHSHSPAGVFDVGSSTSHLNTTDASDNYINIAPPTLSALLTSDVIANPLCRQFDGKPLYFTQLQAALATMDDEKVSVVVHRLSNAMRDYPSVSWLLLLIEEMRARHIPLPLGLLRNGVKMCSERNDMYGLLEILHAAHREKVISSEPQFQRNLVKLRHHARYQSGLDLDSQVDSHTLEEMNAHSFDNNNNDTTEDDTSTNTSSSTSTRTARRASFTPAIDTLSMYDWNAACALVFRNTHANIPMNSRQEAFAEVMLLMNKCGVHVAHDTVKTLLDFLVHTHDSSGHLWKIIERICTDEKIQVTHRQCVALSTLLTRRISTPASKLLQVCGNSVYNENYLYVFPNTLHKMSDLALEANGDADLLGVRFRDKFTTHWANLHHPEGRKGLYEMLDEAVNSHVCRTLAIPTMHAQRDAFTLLSMYTAYLITVHDGDARNAFVLLAGAERMHLNAAAQSERRSKENDTTSNSGRSDRGRSSRYSTSTTSSVSSRARRGESDTDRFARYQNIDEDDYKY